MKKQLICLLMILPIAVMFIVYGVGSTIKLAVDLKPEYIVVDYQDGDELIVESLGDTLQLYGRAYPLSSKAKLFWSVSKSENDEEIASVEGDKLTVTGEGRVTVSASLADGSLKTSFTAFLLLEGDEPRFVYAAIAGLPAGGVVGEYVLEEGKKVKQNSLPLSLKVVPSKASASIEFDPLQTDCRFDDKNLLLTFNVAGPKRVAFRAGNLNSYLSFEVIENGVNVFDYEDLLACTNRSEKGEIAVMRVNLESSANADRPDSTLFGFKEGDKVKCEYDTFVSTYDVTYFKNLGLSQEAYSLKTGIVIKKDFYGNGYTLNAHELCFPTASVAVEGGFKPYPAAADPFKGPLAFIEAIGLTVYGQDNSAFKIAKGVTVKNATFKSCNNVADLTHLDYVGTTMEVSGDGVTIEGCTVMNGRTVLRSFSSQNLLLKDCTFSYGREFIFKMGSNSFVKGVNGSFEQLAPLPKDEAGNVLSDSSAVVEDCKFNASGMFCIGIDTHFAGAYLAGAIVESFPYAYDMAATSYASRLTLKGKVVLDDWKPVSSLDSSTLISGQTAGNTIFDLKALMDRASKEGEIYDNVNGQPYVHGGIALFGGGRNLSSIDFAAMEGGNKLKKLSFSLNDPQFADVNGPLLSKCAGEGPFTFYIETEYHS